MAGNEEIDGSVATYDRAYAEVWQILDRAFATKDEAKRWLNTQLPALDDRTPKQVWRSRRGHVMLLNYCRKIFAEGKL